MNCSHILAALPAEVRQVVRHNSNEQLLHNLSECLLETDNTDRLFPALEQLLPELVARWLTTSDASPKVIAALGRIAPAQTYLLQHARSYLNHHRVDRTLWNTYPESELISLMLGLYRLCVQDVDCMTCFIQPADLLFGLQHSSTIVRFLVIRVMCLYLHAADAATQELIRKYVGDGPLNGSWEQIEIDYRFFTLWENKRWKDIASALETAAQSRQSVMHGMDSELERQILTDGDLKGSVQVAGSLLSYLNRPASTTSSMSHFVETPTATANMQSLIKAITSPQPVLLNGTAGTGKTTMVNHLAARLGKLDSMVTLQLNEQSDVKILLGLYTSGQELGTFVWKPGVLTTAVREGRWVLIEDLDRAPNEVISALLPLVERNELFLPGRGESIKAAVGFKLIATIRTTSGSTRQFTTNLIGKRFWNHVHISELTDTEIRFIVRSRFPQLSSRADDFVHVYIQVRAIAESQSFRVKVNSSSARAVTPRDLFKWCHRISSLLAGTNRFNEQIIDVLFLEAIDCFAGYLPAGDAYDSISACIAQQLHIDPDRRDHIQQARTIKLGLKEPGSKTVQIGRVSLYRDAQSRKRHLASSRFSTNPHTACLLEKVASAVKYNEPLLLVGETGTGKTTTIQYLAKQLGKRLVPFNLSQQSESSDLLGGFKPVDTRAIVLNVQDEFEQLFTITFSSRDNSQYVELLNKSIAKLQWRRVCKLWKGAIVEVKKRILDDLDGDVQDIHRNKKQRLAPTNDKESGRKITQHTQNRWRKLIDDVDQFEARLSSSESAFAFNFLEGNIIKAARNGDWILLDEINLAAPDTLEALADLLNHDNNAGPPSILLTEAGKVERIVAHPEFRVFAAMNPATDVGKRDLPVGIRSRFTELYVESPDRDLRSLQHIVQTYLGDGMTEKSIIADVAQLHLQIQTLSQDNKLVDGSGQQPHFSLRTLTRSLTFARDVTPFCGLRRGLFEGFSMSYLTFLDKASEELLLPMFHKQIFSTSVRSKSELSKALRKPEDGRTYIAYRHFWLRRGNFEPQAQPHYIVTPFVERNLDNLVRAIFSRRAPVLIQGPTSSGKTSMVEFLAKMSGNKFVRINNHEHTDLQEYLGTYVSDANGVLKFQEGILVEALRKGYWIVLDELNLAPSDVLEALNRLLDDNRELLIPETQETVKPHEDFMLFATQNPAGLYGGRKPLSRAFRNRFLELHFDDIPVDELCEILHQRTQIPESWSRRIVDAYKELSTLRQVNRLFENKSFATLRDLFRWALRKADSVEELATNGYLLLAERVRQADEREKVKEIIETVMSRRGPRVRVDTSSLYSAHKSPEIAAYVAQANGSSHDVVWTKAMRRLYVLVAHALRNNEPILLVGETGCGKTTVCQMLAHAVGKTLHIVNAHQNTETGDLIGSQRPIRNRSAIEHELRILLAHLSGASEHDAALLTIDELLAQFDQQVNNNPRAIDARNIDRVHELRSKRLALFEWSDGSLVTAMKSGHYFLLDEISLADDSVLERLNSVLEPQRYLFLAEKGPIDSDVYAADGFQFFATMNPGGDYGKRELSPALRNRFTEIWVPAIDDMDDIQDIVAAKLTSMPSMSNSIVAFAKWFSDVFSRNEIASVSIRDVLACVDFLKSSQQPINESSLLHAISMVFVDSLGANPAGMLSITHLSLADQRARCIERLEELSGKELSHIYKAVPELVVSDTSLQVGDYSLSRLASLDSDTSFTFLAPTTRTNAMRIVRALQIKKPLLIEGDPGVGKTTIVSSLAKIVGKHLTRINLSEQTDLMDLFGSDVPMEGAAAGQFTWQDAPFLTAMKKGDWVLLDEMNLASQSVLEGLNACLDHRGEVYIAELDQAFSRHPNFRLFAAQNPHHQGGGRKGLPASFVNRFTVVYADPFTHTDLNIICERLYPTVDASLIQSLTSFVTDMNTKAAQSRTFGALGSPWEFNLRDTLRWLQLLQSDNSHLLPSSVASPYDLSDIIYGRRFRTVSDNATWQRLFQDNFGQAPETRSFFHIVTEEICQVGLSIFNRSALIQSTVVSTKVPVHHLPVLESLMLCVQLSWPVILVGSSGSGKSTLLKHMAALYGSKLTVMTMNADVDATDLVGGFEQADYTRRITKYLSTLQEFVQRQTVQACLDHDVRLSATTTTLLALIDNVADESLGTVLATCLELLSQLADSDVLEIAQLQEEVKVLQTRSLSHEKARFEWVDGLLVQALINGDWLVLDNANLCSSSVLDRLNSLMEPNGSLIINEHPLSNGEARVIRPHPKFRIFLTMDPKYGELSRAMRNRALELFLFHSEENDYITPRGPIDSTVNRFGQILELLEETSLQSTHVPLVAQLAVDHLVEPDLLLLPAFEAQISAGLLKAEHSSDLSSAIVRISQPSVSSPWLAWYGKRKEVLSLQNHDIEGILTIHPLNNLQAVRCLPVAINNVSFYSQIGDAVHRQITIEECITVLDDLLSTSSSSMKRHPSRASNLRTNVLNYLVAQSMDVKRFFHVLLEDASQGQNRSELAVFEQLQIQWLFLIEYMIDSEALDMSIQIALQLIHAALAKSQVNSGDDTSISFATHQHNVLSRLLHLDVKSGWFMENLWATFKPTIPPTYDAFIQLDSLGSLADVFDEYRWSSSVDFVSLVETRDAFCKIAALLKGPVLPEDIQNLLEDSQRAITSLRDVEYDPRGSRRPFFQHDFDLIHRRLELEVAISSNYNIPLAEIQHDIAILAGTSTRALMDLAGERNQRAILLHHVCDYQQRNQDEIIDDHDNDASIRKQPLLAKVRNSGNVTLRNLALLRKELAVLGSLWARHAYVLCDDGQQKLLSVLHMLKDIVQETTEEVSEHLTSPVQQELLTYLRPLQQFLRQDDTSSKAQLGMAFMNLAIVSILSYVPKVLIDPLAKTHIAQDMRWFDYCYWDQFLAAFNYFDPRFDGQESFRAREIQHRRDTIQDATPPSNAGVAERPMKSLMDQLQQEFDHVLRIVNVLATRLSQGDVHDSSARESLTQIVTRLQVNYRAYRDITLPLIGFVIMLTLGLDLYFADMTTTQSNQELQPVLLFTRLNESSGSLDIKELRRLALLRTIHGSLCDHEQISVENILTSLHHDWKQLVELAQEKNTLRSNLYTFKGSYSDEEEEGEREFEELFPEDYEVQDHQQERSGDGTLDVSIAIADLHDSIFSDRPETTMSLLDEIRSIPGSSTSLIHIESVPLLLLHIRERRDLIDDSATIEKLYNVYKDANISEALKLIQLIRKVQARFKSLQMTWPEHATLAEVLRLSTEVLDFEYTEPVMKFLTKCEKLHEAIYEWQKVASQQYTAAPLYDELTATIVNWRRLELSTWLRLFDLEVRNCKRDAKSWWFIAYESIITASESIVQDERDLSSHALHMIITLERFMRETSVGQFATRLHLLTTFSHDIRTRLAHVPKLVVIYNALSNFVAFYARFQEPIDNYIHTERLKLERDVKEVVQLASWKDTNIDALKQSAKTSHRKLFKVIRKFRSLLRQSSMAIIERGPPEVQLQETEQLNCLARDNTASEVAIELLADEQALHSWPARFIRIPTTVKLMTRLVTTQDHPKVAGASHISDFIIKLHASMEQLQKATPSLLTDENKDMVKHLKVQKRSLFAETLKEMRLMGLQYNLPSGVLERQSTAAKVMVAVPAAKSTSQTMTNSDYYFHKTLALIDQVRDVQKEHSGDLTPAEVSRSTGYLEALWQKTIRQRGKITDAFSILDRFQSILRLINGLSGTITSKETISSISHSTNISSLGLPAIQRLAHRIVHACETVVVLVKAQCSLGDQDGDVVIADVQKWIGTFIGFSKDMDELQSLPAHLTSSLHGQMIEDIVTKVSTFDQAIDHWMVESPFLKPVLLSLQPVTKLSSEQIATNGFATDKAFDDLRIALFDVVDSILARVQEVEAAQSRLNADTTLQSWFAHEDDTKSSIVSVLSTEKINAKLIDLLERLHHLPSHYLRVATLTITSLSPILHEFNRITHVCVGDYVRLHEATAHLTYKLSNIFVTLGKNGFCTPPDKSSGGESGNEKLEGGTGLGDGEGAEDISKDIGDDEDLTELAEQQQDPSDRKDMEDEQDAVDMADADLQGQEDDVEEKQDDEADPESNDDDDEEDMDDEVGDVDDLGPSAVDEKMWDDGGKENEKDKEGKEGQGSKDNEQVAAEQGSGSEDSDNENEAENEQEMPAEETEAVAQDRPEMLDEHMPDGENLDLPEQMDIDGQSQAGTDDDRDDDMDDLNDVNDPGDDSELDAAEEGEDDFNGSEVDDGHDLEHGDSPADPQDVASEDEAKDGEGDDTEEGVNDLDEENEIENPQEQPLRAQDQDQAAEDAAPSDQKGTGLEADDIHQNQQDAASTAQDTQGAETEEHGAQASGNRGSGEDNGSKDAVGRAEGDETVESQPFKKLGDVLEQWYNQQKTIRAPPEDSAPRKPEGDVDMKDVDFEHIADEDAEANAQALGAATEEQASALNQDNAVPVDEDKSAQPFEDADEHTQEEVAEKPVEHDHKLMNEPSAGQPNAFVGDQKPLQAHQGDPDTVNMEVDEDDVELDIASISISPPEDKITQNYEQAQAIWLKHELATRPLATTLSEQLRLVLAPTLATKLRGDFRTGKRLNIKRIIPYIASSYKRDKIWMRRSIPSKRSYQIMIALDDSKSMADATEGEGSNKVDLAFQTLALIAKSLSMLEAGDLCFLGFGQDIKNAHPFGTPFTDDAGAKVCQAFTFQQESTDVCKLIKEALELFRSARSSSQGATADLWQLMLIISDGVCEDHATITQLVRQAQDERVMVVFVIVDQNSSTADGKAQSIMDLQSAEFKADANGEMKVVRTKYMDTFPFRWWIVVRDVRELPVVLAAALRQWFSEVVDST